MSEIQDWSLVKCIEWLNHPYNQPRPETDDSFDRIFRAVVINQMYKKNKKKKKKKKKNRINL
jgi:hypothetical protein